MDELGGSARTERSAPAVRVTPTGEARSEPHAGGRAESRAGGAGVSAHGQEPHRIKVLERAFGVLAALAAADRPLTLPALAGILETSPQQAHRVIRALQARRFVARADEGGYTLGAGLWPLGATALSAQSFWREATPYLAQLREATGSALVATLRGGRVLEVDKLRPDGVARGIPVPAHATALGKVLLGALPAGELRVVLAEVRLERYTDHTITEARALRAELECVRRHGYAVAAGELRPGHWQAGVPICDHTGRAIAAIGIDNRRARVLPPADEGALIALVVAAGRGLSRALGAEQASLVGPRELVIEEKAPPYDA